MTASRSALSLIALTACLTVLQQGRIGGAQRSSGQVSAVQRRPQPAPPLQPPIAGQQAAGAQPSTSQTPQIPQLDEALRQDVQRLTNRLVELEIELAKQPAPQTGLMIAIVAGSATLAAALFGGLLTLIGQYLAGKREERRALENAQRALVLAKTAALFQHTEKILEYRLKQMEQFYAPMFALLEQSRALYEKLFLQLVEDEPGRYQLSSTPDSQKRRLVLASDGTWQEFRLLDQLPAVKKNQKALPLVKQILEIGDRMTKTISSHAGLAAKDIIDLLGEYLAHYAVLATVYNGTESDAYEPGWHKIAYYPRELNSKIEAGYREVSAFLDAYADASNRLLDALPRGKSEA